MDITGWIAIGLFVLGAVVVGAWWIVPKDNIEEIEPHEAERLVRSGAAFLDVRQSFEYKHGHAQGARNVPLTGLSAENLAEVRENRPVVLICASGHRSVVAARRMKKLGYTRTYSVKGGTPAWHSAQLPMEE